jgi:hypothetical protein
VLALQDGAQVEKERQRAAGRVQQLQAELGAMRSQQDKLRMRLQERLTLQEKDAAAKARELASLKRAGECRTASGHAESNHWLDPPAVTGRIHQHQHQCKASSGKRSHVLAATCDSTNKHHVLPCMLPTCRS